jgi:xanthine dehydrogenase accessory factor
MAQLHNRRTPFVIATTTSRKLLVTATSCYPPEHDDDDVSALARELLASRASACSHECGDNSVLLEPVTSSKFNVAVFGAGHVGSAVVQTLAGLDCNIRWIDSRRNIFPAGTAANVLQVESDDPGREVAAMPDDAYYLVLTHSHPLDYEICSRVLERGEFTYLGLIGSAAKRRRFERLMRQQGMSQSLLGRLTCPIGIDGINGKKPQEIAIAATAELLQRRDAVAIRSVSTDNNLHVM